MSSHLGQNFSITTFGESHGPGIGVVIDGCPAGIELDLEHIQQQLNRRRPGQNHLSTPRDEKDRFEVLSGLYEGRTLGTSLTLYVSNGDARSGDYQRWAEVYRPSHADYTYHAKYGHRTPLGGGRASVREAIGRVAAGAVAAQILKAELGIEVIAWVESVGSLRAGGFKQLPSSRDEVDQSPVRCHLPEAAAAMVSQIEKVKSERDSIGGTIGVVIRNTPPGLGDPVFDKLEASLAAAFLSIPACKGFESGSGFAGSEMRGSEHNDPFMPTETSGEKGPPAWLTTSSNRSGGIQGGISSGMPITARLAFKPTATIARDQQTVNSAGEAVILKAGGRHDPCVLPRAVPIVEAMAELVLIDAVLRQRAQQPEWWQRYKKS